MDFATVLQRARDGLPITRIQIEGGQTEGRIAMDIRKPKAKGRTIMSGLHYAEESRAQDRLEQLKLDEEQNNANMFGCEELTSVGTLPNLNDLKPENLTNVYQSYCFKTKMGANLLIHDYKEEILGHIDTYQVVIVKGVTGCGKTTQVPQFILDQHEEMNIHCNIVVTQPRRIAAISVAKRVSNERGWPLGSIVGYQIALERNCSQDTRLIYCTTGVLLQQLVKKQSLSDYTHIIVDEVHERDNETDFLLIILKKLLRNPQCRTKVILMSATMNVNQFSDYFSRAVNGVPIEPPVVELAHIAKYPVQYYYLDSLTNRLPGIKIPEINLNSPSISTYSYDLARALIEVFRVIDEHEHHDTNFIGSVLIFLPGIAEIETMYARLVSYKGSAEKWWLCPLHSSVTYDEQMKVFQPAPKGHRKIILATNIAESSITVPDIKYVIDFCLAKQQVLEPETGYSCLQLTWISKSQGTQRGGRVGRVMPGRVYRLIPKDSYAELSEDITPEIMRCPLDQLVLKAKQLRMGNPSTLLGLAIDPPDLSNIHKTILHLKEAGALLLTANGEYKDNDGDLTFIGQIMASLPLDIHLSKLIILGHMFSCLSDAIVMASAMSVKSIFSTPFRQQLEAYNSKLTWADSTCSDPIAYLHAYSLWKFKSKMGYFKRSGGESEIDWCRKCFVQGNLIKEVSRLENEIVQRLRTLGVEEMKGETTVTWTAAEKPVILKLMIAGAFYPNYFIPFGSDEKDAVKLLGGRDPHTTVYLTGLPNNQPGPLYTHAIRSHFLHCGSNIEVSFDGSSKIYLTFGSSITTNHEPEKSALMPGKISMAVYRSIKLRQLQIPIIVPVLLPHEARKRALEVFGDRLTPSLFNVNKRKAVTPIKKTNMPSLGTSIIPVIVTHIENPSKFWVNINEPVNSNRIYWIHSSLNRLSEPLPLYTGPYDDGSPCVAPYKDKKGPPEYYRARIISSIEIDERRVVTRVQVFFIDYGNQESVYTKELRDYPKSLDNVKEEPDLALEASLAEIGPSFAKNPKGGWSPENCKEFNKFLRNNTGIAKIFSVVNNVMAVTLFSSELIGKQTKTDLPFEMSLNYYLIKNGFAEPMDEPYLSRENHMLREASEKSSTANNCLDILNADLYNDNLSDINFAPPKPEECRSKITLKGPRSPLEMNLYSLPKKCQGKETIIEWNSVNSVLLDTYPMDPHSRLVIAASVTQNAGTNRLTLRNTTIMPNIHGLSSLVCLIFAPRVELRVDTERRQLTGAVCGLGFEPESGAAFFPENDLEVLFDTKITLMDIEVVNKLRFWMDYIMGGGEGPHSELSRPGIIKSQERIKTYITDLLFKKRPCITPQPVSYPYEWDQLEPDELLDPQGSDTSLYPLIWGVSLVGEGARDNAILSRLETLKMIAEGKETFKTAVQCELCQVYNETLQELRLHLTTTLHTMKLADFKESMRAEKKK